MSITQVSVHDLDLNVEDRLRMARERILRRFHRADEPTRKGKPDRRGRQRRCSGGLVRTGGRGRNALNDLADLMVSQMKLQDPILVIADLPAEARRLQTRREQGMLLDDLRKQIMTEALKSMIAEEMLEHRDGAWQILWPVIEYHAITRREAKRASRRQLSVA